MKLTNAVFVLLTCFMPVVIAQPTATNSEIVVDIQTDSTIIRGNDELPKVTFIVPWNNGELDDGEGTPLILHSLYGDLYDPVQPGIDGMPK